MFSFSNQEYTNFIAVEPATLKKENRHFEKKIGMNMLSFPGSVMLGLFQLFRGYHFMASKIRSLFGLGVDTNY